MMKEIEELKMIVDELTGFAEQEGGDMGTALAAVAANIDVIATRLRRANPLSNVDAEQRRAAFASMMAPTEFAAWEAVDAALQAWPGPGNVAHVTAERDAWRQRAQASLHMGIGAAERERREADERLRALGVDPGAVQEVA